MRPFLERIFYKHHDNKKQNKLLGDVKSLSDASNEVGKRVEDLNKLEMGILLEQRDEYFLSLDDFLEIIDLDDWRFSDIVSKFKHISDIDTSKFSTVEIVAIPDNDHIILCPDPKTCKQHKDFKGDTLKIVSVRRKTRVR